MSGDTRAAWYPRLGSAAVSNDNAGAAVYAAWGQLFFNSFTVAVSLDLTTLGVVGITFTRELTSAAAVTTTDTRSLTSSLVTAATVTRALASDATLSVSVVRSLSSDAALTTTDSRSLSSAAALTLNPEDDVTSGAALSVTVVQSASATAVLTTTDSRSLTSAGVVAFAKSGDLTTGAVIGVAQHRDLGTAAVAQAAATRALTTSGAMGASAYYDVNSLGVLARLPAHDLGTTAVLRTSVHRDLSTGAAILQAPHDLHTTAAVSVARQLEALTRAAVFNAALTTSVGGRLVDVSGRPVAGVELVCELVRGASARSRPVADGHLAAVRPLATRTLADGSFSFRLLRPDRFPQLPTRYLLRGPGVRAFFRTLGPSPSYLGGFARPPALVIQTCVVTGSVHDLAGQGRGGLQLGYGQGEENLTLTDGTLVSLAPLVVQPATDGSFSVTLIAASQFRVGA